MIEIILFEPQIPQNTGNIGRICAFSNCKLHLIHPLGFQTDDKAVRRAGLDYWKHVDVVEHSSAETFWSWAAGRRVFPFTTKSTVSYARIAWASGDVLLFGPESKGLDAEVLAERGGWTIPMTGPIRSLNLSNAVAVVAYAALHQLEEDLF